MDLEKLKYLGINEFITKKLEEYRSNNKYKIARIFNQHSSLYHIAFSKEEKAFAFLSGKFKKKINSKIEIPVTGDWVIVEPKTKDLFPVVDRIKRYSQIVRYNKNKRYPQVIAANIDIAFIVISADKYNFEKERIKKYISLVENENNISYKLIINKIDLGDINTIKKTIDELKIKDEDVIFLDSIKKIGYEKLNRELKEFKTSVLIGHSGAGKSTIINNLYGKNIKKIAEPNPKNMKGRQTTTTRDLIILSNNHIIMDIPGINFTIDNYDEIIRIINQFACECKFTDCKHISEPECAVKKAVKENLIPNEIYKNYLQIIKNEKI